MAYDSNSNYFANIKILTEKDQLNNE